MRRALLGLVLLAFAPVAWIVGALSVGLQDVFLDLAIVLVGLGLAVAGEARGPRWLAAAGFAIAASGIAMFYDFTWGRGLAPMAGLVFLAGCLACAVASVAGSRRTLAAGLVVLAVAGALWVVADGTDGLEWQAGNVLTLVGGAMAAWGTWPQRAA